MIRNVFRRLGPRPVRRTTHFLIVDRSTPTYADAALIAHALKLAFVTAQVLWMLVVLPGHVRGQITRGDACCGPKPAATVDAEDRCCKSKHTGSSPSDDPDRRARCAVCYQALGYDLPPVYDFDLAPIGLCRLRLLIGPTRLHHQAVRPTYLANGPPAQHARLSSDPDRSAGRSVVNRRRVRERQWPRV